MQLFPDVLVVRTLEPVLASILLLAYQGSPIKRAGL